MALAGPARGSREAANRGVTKPLVLAHCQSWTLLLTACSQWQAGCSSGNSQAGLRNKGDLGCQCNLFLLSLTVPPHWHLFTELYGAHDGDKSRDPIVSCGCFLSQVLTRCWSYRVRSLQYQGPRPDVLLISLQPCCDLIHGDA